jgi:hypothetical protein
MLMMLSFVVNVISLLVFPRINLLPKIADTLTSALVLIGHFRYLQAVGFFSRDEFIQQEEAQPSV